MVLTLQTNFILKKKEPMANAIGSFCQRSLAEFALASAKEMEIIFSGGVYVGENTSRLANVRIVRCERTMRALRRAAAFSNESPAKRVSFESVSKIFF